MKIFDPRSDPVLWTDGINNDQISFDEDQWRLRVSWDNRKVKKSAFTLWFMIIFIIIWFPLTCFTTAMVIVSDDLEVFLIFWSIMAWLGTFGIIYALLIQLSSQWIEIDKNKISYGWDGLFGRREKTFPVSKVEELALGLNSNRGHHESMTTLNLYELFENPHSFKALFTGRHLIAYWLSEENKKMVFHRISKFISDNNIDIKVTTYDYVNE